MHLFFVNPHDVQREELIIRGQEAIHINRVLRYSTGDEIHATDGNGYLYRCKISRVIKDELTAEIRNTDFEARPLPYLTLCMGIIKKRDRLELSIEKAIELGADEVVLFRGAYSQKENVRQDRIESVVLSAMKQSLRRWLPKIRVVNSLEEAFTYQNEPSVVAFADETTKAGQDGLKKSDHYYLVVGPEGGFSESERSLLQSKNAIAFSLGKKRLRTETAAIVAVYQFKGM